MNIDTDTLGKFFKILNNGWERTLERSIEDGTLRDLLNANPSKISRRELRRAVGLVPFNSEDVMLGERNAPKVAFPQKKEELERLRGHGGVLLVPQREDLLRRAADALADVGDDPSFYRGERSEGRLFCDVDFRDLTRPVENLEEAMRQDGFYPGDLGDLSRIDISWQADAPVCDMWIASTRSVPVSRRKSPHFFVAGPYKKDSGSRPLDLLSWKELQRLAKKNRVGFLGVETDPDKK